MLHRYCSTASKGCYSSRLFVRCTCADAPASVSTACDNLLEQLNDLSFVGDEAHQERCLHLRYRIDYLNAGQGLGFRVMGTVVDRRTLLKAVMAVGSASGGIITTLIAVGTSKDIADGSIE